MNFSKIFNEIKDSSSFDLFRLKCAIDVELESSQRLDSIRNSLKIGQKITYFSADENRLIPSAILKINQKKVLVVHLENKEQWYIYYHSINIDNSNIEIESKNKSLTKQDLKVGDEVGFTHKGVDIFGKIIRLNQKTVTLRTSPIQTWRVGYGNLFLIIESDIIDVIPAIEDKN